VRKGSRLTAAGLVGGGALRLAVSIGQRSLLIGVAPTDAPTYAEVFVLLGAASLIACYLPARSSSRIDSMQPARRVTFELDLQAVGYELFV